ncbi:MAG: HlyC/CorC family transporter [Gammaproteobacteria bacterium]|nr:HlyC/CorC family transporter [Gammaproteobacteria bacterium]MCP5425482.1 HlyC/CorC family transporter [Gammaproteobacteria bacterium]MCP5459915.1 HlyC/CorC family transporter [Gammaproteobacteria bacterium]
MLILSGLFSGSETALTTLSMARAEGLFKEGRRGSKALFQLKSNPTRMLITLLIGNNLVNIGASAMATVIAVQHLGHLGPGVAVGVLTLFILLFGEVTPKTLAIRYAERISLGVAPIMLGFRWLSFPLVWALEHFITQVQRLTQLSGDPTVTSAELINLVLSGEREGTIDRGERQLIERIFEFGNLQVRDVMTHRRQIFALDAHRSIRDALPEILEEAYSRIPLYDQHPDDIRSLVYSRDILAAVAKGQIDTPLSALAQEPLYVAKNQPIDQLFATLRRGKQHMAIVVDEYGAVQGLVTLEDLLEELVGEIYDETDVAPQELQVLGDDLIAVSGTAELRVVENFFNLSLPGKPTDTVSFWILDHAERIPESGEKLELDGLEVTVAKATHNRIQQVLIKPALERLQALREHHQADG